jgi:hypothetical protein
MNSSVFSSVLMMALSLGLASAATGCAVADEEVLADDTDGVDFVENVGESQEAAAIATSSAPLNISSGGFTHRYFRTTGAYGSRAYTRLTYQKLQGTTVKASFTVDVPSTFGNTSYGFSKLAGNTSGSVAATSPLQVLHYEQTATATWNWRSTANVGISKESSNFSSSLSGISSMMSSAASVANTYSLASSTPPRNAGCAAMFNTLFSGARSSSALSACRKAAQNTASSTDSHNCQSSVSATNSYLAPLVELCK